MNEDMDISKQRAGFVAFVGAPNAGKSTAINHMVGTKVSIVSPKVQTTRTRVLGIMMKEETQIIFVDTPGIFAPKRRLDRAMVAAAWGGAADADHIVVLVDAKRGICNETQTIINTLKEQKRKAILILNKIDLVDKGTLLTLTEKLNGEEIFTDTFMVSALKGDGLDYFVDFIAQKLPQGPWLFPEDQVSDMPERLLAAEITREQLYLKLRQELPYSTTVETETWEEKKDGSIKIEQIIYVARDGQKKIILGKGGQQIKAIGANARKQLEEIMECRVHLFLFVKVRDKWSDDPERYNYWGLDYNA
ncbi:membrane-associated, 16S rRNA-binding GTPase [Candidatus Terasakiella magnetica]|uniref:GTPase Era n=1 Tax=Candidatus Terasakiella magnetica TaxID=1867952 RepID=A0A1C3RCT9_9PROT|nr:GTPase Era [Candidatus Terasakiella magnetica]SCA55096.1 membrane-associated, 16S rRNA-binding GTPase [Candidatus Terasakiella magnetica]